jgi:hypothetical protein
MIYKDLLTRRRTGTEGESPPLQEIVAKALYYNAVHVPLLLPFSRGQTPREHVFLTSDT